MGHGLPGLQAQVLLSAGVQSRPGQRYFPGFDIGCRAGNRRPRAAGGAMVSIRISLDLRPGEPHNPTMTTAAPIIELKGITFGYPGGPPILRDLDFTLRTGERIGV